jgi:hypothetical protein
VWAAAVRAGWLPAAPVDEAEGRGHARCCSPARASRAARPRGPGRGHGLLRRRASLRGDGWVHSGGM